MESTAVPELLEPISLDPQESSDDPILVTGKLAPRSKTTPKETQNQRDVIDKVQTEKYRTNGKTKLRVPASAQPTQQPAPQQSTPSEPFTFRQDGTLTKPNFLGIQGLDIVVPAPVVTAGSQMVQGIRDVFGTNKVAPVSQKYKENIANQSQARVDYLANPTKNAGQVAQEWRTNVAQSLKKPIAQITDADLVRAAEREGYVTFEPTNDGGFKVYRNQFGTKNKGADNKATLPLGKLTADGRYSPMMFTSGGKPVSKQQVEEQAQKKAGFGATIVNNITRPFSGDAATDISLNQQGNAGAEMVQNFGVPIALSLASRGRINPTVLGAASGVINTGLEQAGKLNQGDNTIEQAVENTVNSGVWGALGGKAAQVAGNTQSVPLSFLRNAVADVGTALPEVGVKTAIDMQNTQGLTRDQLMKAVQQNMLSALPTTVGVSVGTNAVPLLFRNRTNAQPNIRPEDEVMDAEWEDVTGIPRLTPTTPEGLGTTTQPAQVNPRTPQQLPEARSTQFEQQGSGESRVVPQGVDPNDLKARFELQRVNEALQRNPNDQQLLARREAAMRRLGLDVEMGTEAAQRYQEDRANAERIQDVRNSFGVPVRQGTDDAPIDTPIETTQPRATTPSVDQAPKVEITDELPPNLQSTLLQLQKQLEEVRDSLKGKKPTQTNEGAPEQQQVTTTPTVQQSAQQGVSAATAPTASNPAPVATPQPKPIAQNLTNTTQGNPSVRPAAVQKTAQPIVSDVVTDNIKIQARQNGQPIQLPSGETIAMQGNLFAGENPHGTLGRAQNIVFQAKNGKTVKAPGRYAVVEADTVISSQVQGRENPKHLYPDAQPRSTDVADTAAREQYISQNLDPELLLDNVTAYHGAPVVTQNGYGVQGNGRSAAIIEYYKNNPTDPNGYRQAIIDNADRLGLKPEDIQKYKQPMLVRVLDTTDDAEIVALGNYSSRDTEADADNATRMRGVVGQMDDNQRTQFANLMANLADNSGENPTLTALVNNHRAAFENVLPKSLFPNGLDAEGVQNIKKFAVEEFFGGASGAAKIVSDPNFPTSHSDGIAQALPDLFRLRQAIADGKIVDDANIDTTFNDALALFKRYNAQKETLTVDEFFDQADMFNNNATLRETTPANVVYLTALLASAKTSAETAGQLRKVVDLLVQRKDADMFEDSTPKATSVSDALQQVVLPHLERKIGNNANVPQKQRLNKDEKADTSGFINVIKDNNARATNEPSAEPSTAQPNLLRTNDSSTDGNRPGELESNNPQTVRGDRTADQSGDNSGSRPDQSGGATGASQSGVVKSATGAGLVALAEGFNDDEEYGGISGKALKNLLRFSGLGAIAVAGVRSLKNQGGMLDLFGDTQDAGVSIKDKARALRGETLRGETLRGETLRGETLRGETLRGETLRGETPTQTEQTPTKTERVAIPSDKQTGVKVTPTEDVQSVLDNPPVFDNGKQYFTLRRSADGAMTIEPTANATKEHVTALRVLLNAFDQTRPIERLTGALRSDNPESVPTLYIRRGSTEADVARKSNMVDRALDILQGQGIIVGARNEQGRVPTLKERLAMERAKTYQGNNLDAVQTADQDAQMRSLLESGTATFSNNQAAIAQALFGTEKLPNAFNNGVIKITTQPDKKIKVEIAPVELGALNKIHNVSYQGFADVIFSRADISGSTFRQFAQAHDLDAAKIKTLYDKHASDLRYNKSPKEKILDGDGVRVRIATNTDTGRPQITISSTESKGELADGTAQSGYDVYARNANTQAVEDAPTAEQAADADGIDTRTVNTTGTKDDMIFTDNEDTSGGIDELFGSPVSVTRGDAARAKEIAKAPGDYAVASVIRAVDSIPNASVAHTIKDSNGNPVMVVVKGGSALEIQKKAQAMLNKRDKGFRALLNTGEAGESQYIASEVNELLSDAAKRNMGENNPQRKETLRYIQSLIDNGTLQGNAKDYSLWGMTAAAGLYGALSDDEDAKGGATMGAIGLAGKGKLKKKVPSEALKIVKSGDTNAMAAWMRTAKVEDIAPLLSRTGNVSPESLNQQLVGKTPEQIQRITDTWAKVAVEGQVPVQQGDIVTLAVAANNQFTKQIADRASEADRANSRVSRIVRAELEPYTKEREPNEAKVAAYARYKVDQETTRILRTISDQEQRRQALAEATSTAAIQKHIASGEALLRKQGLLNEGQSVNADKTLDFYDTLNGVQSFVVTPFTEGSRSAALAGTHEIQPEFTPTDIKSVSVPKEIVDTWKQDQAQYMDDIAAAKETVEKFAQSVGGEVNYTSNTIRAIGDTKITPSDRKRAEAMLKNIAQTQKRLDNVTHKITEVEKVPQLINESHERHYASRWDYVTRGGGERKPAKFFGRIKSSQIDPSTGEPIDIRVFGEDRASVEEQLGLYAERLGLPDPRTATPEQAMQGAAKDGSQVNLGNGTMIEVKPFTTGHYNQKPQDQIAAQLQSLIMTEPGGMSARTMAQVQKEIDALDDLYTQALADPNMQAYLPTIEDALNELKRMGTKSPADLIAQMIADIRSPKTPRRLHRKDTQGYMPLVKNADGSIEVDMSKMSDWALGGIIAGVERGKSFLESAKVRGVITEQQNLLNEVGLEHSDYGTWLNNYRASLGERSNFDQLPLGGLRFAGAGLSVAYLGLNAVSGLFKNVLQAVQLGVLKPILETGNILAPVLYAPTAIGVIGNAVVGRLKQKRGAENITPAQEFLGDVYSELKLGGALYRSIADNVRTNAGKSTIAGATVQGAMVFQRMGDYLTRVLSFGYSFPRIMEIMDDVSIPYQERVRKAANEVETTANFSIGKYEEKFGTAIERGTQGQVFDAIAPLIRPYVRSLYTMYTSIKSAGYNDEAVQRALKIAGGVAGLSALAILAGGKNAMPGVSDVTSFAGEYLSDMRLNTEDGSIEVHKDKNERVSGAQGVTLESFEEKLYRTAREIAGDAGETIVKLYEVGLPSMITGTDLRWDSRLSNAIPAVIEFASTVQKKGVVPALMGITPTMVKRALDAGKELVTGERVKKWEYTGESVEETGGRLGTARRFWVGDSLEDKIANERQYTWAVPLGNTQSQNKFISTIATALEESMDSEEAKQAVADYIAKNKGNTEKALTAIRDEAYRTFNSTIATENNPERFTAKQALDHSEKLFAKFWDGIEEQMKQGNPTARALVKSFGADADTKQARDNMRLAIRSFYGSYSLRHALAKQKLSDAADVDIEVADVNPSSSAKEFLSGGIESLSSLDTVPMSNFTFKTAGFLYALKKVSAAMKKYESNTVIRLAKKK